MPAAYFNPRSPHGERRFSIDAVRGRAKFQSTLPARGATSTVQYLCYPKSISIHAPRTGSDLTRALQSCKAFISIHAPRTGSDAPVSVISGEHSNFNPRSPHGERHYHLQGELSQCHFNPRSPHGERRKKTAIRCTQCRISIHAPRTGSDFSGNVIYQHILISIHAPRTGSDAVDWIAVGV